MGTKAALAVVSGFLLLAGAEHAQSAPAPRPDPLVALADEFAARVTGPRLRLAVLEFHYPDSKAGPASLAVQERLTTHLVQTAKFDVVERLHLARILAERKLERTGLVDSHTTQELGRLLGVQVVVVGSLTPVGATAVDVNARVVDVRSGQILSAGIARYTQDSGLAIDPLPHTGGRPLVQIALLLDTSSSMDGLIQQARTRLWQVVNDLAAAERNGRTPVIQVALYEYGNNGLPASRGWIRQVLPFTSDLDRVSERLFALNTNGGQEYCGAVIEDAVRALAWNADPSAYKTIFIAGNEPFTQGPVGFRESVSAARARGIYVNTIYCGAAEEGRRSGWSDGALAGGGDYMSIDQNRAQDPIAAPQDGEIGRLGTEINATFIPYGSEGRTAVARQKTEDGRASAHASSGAAAERSIFKGKDQYAQASWDLVTSVEKGQLKVADVKAERLPAPLRGLTRTQLESLIKQKLKERSRIRARLAVLEKERKSFLEKAQRHTGAGSVDSVMRKSIRKQAAEKSFLFQK